MMIKADASSVATEPEEQNRRSYFDGVDPVELVLSSVTQGSSKAGCKAASDSAEAAVSDSAGSTMSEAADGVVEAAVSDGVSSAIGEAAGGVVEAAGGVAKAVVGGILDGL